MRSRHPRDPQDVAFPEARDAGPLNLGFDTARTLVVAVTLHQPELTFCTMREKQ
jgi:hypothetical protein